MSERRIRNAIINPLLDSSLEDPYVQKSHSHKKISFSYASKDQRKTDKLVAFSNLPQANIRSSKLAQDKRQRAFPDSVIKHTSSQTSTQHISKNQINRMSNFSSHSNLQLDPRDEKIKLPFESQYLSVLLKNKCEISMEPFEDELRDWLVDLIEITTSIGFNHLNKGTLTEKQTKSFVAKNILHNIKEVNQMYRAFPLQKRFQLTKFINEESYKIFDHIGRKYPQTSSKGVSKRIKSRVQAIDNRESDEFDFLLRNKIHIKYRQDGDYSQDIMKIINKLISFSTDVFDSRMELQESNFEVFSEIMELIFDTAGTQSANATMDEVVNILYSKKHKIDSDINKFNSRLARDSNSFETDTETKSLDSKRYLGSKQSDKLVLIGQKIPPDVPLFSDEDIESSKFKAYDSSILRLLTKWAEELRNKIINAQETIYRRRFKFKSNKGRLINLQPTMKTSLYEAAVKEMEKIQQYLKLLKQENYYLQTIFGEEDIKGKYSKNDTKVGVFAAKINQIASQYIFKYLNQLIHSLLTIPIVAAESAQNDWQKAVLQSVDLVTFKIGDMMRCKCSASEYEFLKILNAIDCLHNHAPDVLKIVRIKNRLGSENNDLLINFFFGGKAQCELQLSVLSPEKKDEKNSSKFSHLIYEIVRAELGPLSEMAAMIVQYDPLAYSYSKKESYGPALISTLNKDKINPSGGWSPQMVQRIAFKTKTKLGTRLQYPFICCTCQHLTIVHNPNFFYRDLSNSKRQCNECLMKSYSHADCQNVKKYMIDSNISDADENVFYQNHLSFWDQEGFINQLKNQTQDTISSHWFPRKGFILRLNQKKPKLESFTSMYQPTNSYQIFANKNQQGETTLLLALKIHCEKDRKIENIQKQMKNIVLLVTEGVREVSDGPKSFLVCDRLNCCGLKANPGPIMQREELEEYINHKIVQKSILRQSNMLILNYMSNSLDRLEDYISRITQKNKLWKMRNTVQAIEAFQCKLSSISVVGMFIQLSDLNIAENPNIQSLKGAQSCLNLKYLNCSNCDIESIAELKGLRKLESLNLSNNKRLQSIASLGNHSQLLDLFLKNTAISSLAPLSHCLKLQSLDLEGCRLISSISDVQSINLSYINIVNCIGILAFDLPQTAIQSLKTIEIYKDDIDKSLINSMGVFSMLLSEESRKKSSQTIINSETIDRINKLLSLRRSASAPSE